MHVRAFAAVVLSLVTSLPAFADLTGRAVYDGTPPKPKPIDMKLSPDCAAQHAAPVYEETWVVGANNELKNVVVYVKEGAKLNAPIPKNPVVLEQKGCVYTPHVVTVMVGQQFNASNGDPTLHNVHGVGKQNGEFNFSQPQKGQTDPIPGNKAVETYMIKCDVHGWMKAWVVVLDHPFAAVTDDKGEFTIKGLKPGDYKLVAWHEPALTQELNVTIDANGKPTKPVEFKFSPKKKAAP